MSNVTSGVKSYTESPTLLQYQPKKEFTQEDMPFLTPKKHQLPAIESNPSIPEALNAIFPPKIWEEDGQRFIQYVSQEPATREKARQEEIQRQTKRSQECITRIVNIQDSLCMEKHNQDYTKALCQINVCYSVGFLKHIFLAQFQHSVDGLDGFFGYLSIHLYLGPFVLQTVVDLQQRVHLHILALVTAAF